MGKGKKVEGTGERKGSGQGEGRTGEKASGRGKMRDQRSR